MFGQERYLYRHKVLICRIPKITRTHRALNHQNNSAASSVRRKSSSRLQSFAGIANNDFMGRLTALIARKCYPVGSKLFSTHRLHLQVRILASDKTFNICIRSKAYRLFYRHFDLYMICLIATSAHFRHRIFKKVTFH